MPWILRPLSDTQTEFRPSLIDNGPIKCAESDRQPKVGLPFRAEAQSNGIAITRSEDVLKLIRAACTGSGRYGWGDTGQDMLLTVTLYVLLRRRGWKLNPWPVAGRTVALPRAQLYRTATLGLFVLHAWILALGILFRLCPGLLPWTPDLGVSLIAGHSSIARSLYRVHRRLILMRRTIPPSTWNSPAGPSTVRIP